MSQMFVVVVFFLFLKLWTFINCLEEPVWKNLSKKYSQKLLALTEICAFEDKISPYCTNLSAGSCGLEPMLNNRG